MIEEIKPNLFVFYSPTQGSNAFILVGQKTVLIDASSQENKDDLVNFMKKIGIEPKDVDLVLFTHGHADHFSGSAPFKAADKRMHKRDADYVINKDAMYTASTLFGSSFFPKIDSFFKPDQSIKFKPFNLEVLHCPGHTQGSVCFYDMAQKLFFSGDLFFKGSVGRWDLPSGNKEQLINSIKGVKKLDFDMLLPGHGLVLKEKQKENVDAVLKMLSMQFV